MASVLITGSEGLIGTELKKYFPESYSIDRGDNLPSDRYDYIIHTASNCVIREIIKNPELAKENVDLTFTIMEKARKDKSRIFLFSSGRVPGEENPYVTSKKFMENLALSYRNCYGIEYIIIRPETVWSRTEKNKRVISTWIDLILHDKPVIIYGSEDKELPPIHVTEFAGIFDDIFNRFDTFIYQTISITGQPRRATELIRAIGEYHNKNPVIEFREPELTQPQKCDINGKIVGKIPFEEQLRI